MIRRNRETLRTYFGAGEMPTSEHFGELIDSVLNMSDEGFAKSAENGVEISTPVGYDALVSFYRDQSAKTVRWSMSYGGEHDQLQFHAGSVGARRGQAPVLGLQWASPAGVGAAADTADGASAHEAQARVGINTASPQHTLDVAGVVASRGRVGTYAPAAADTLRADGQWHNLSGPLEGCQCLEVVAGVGQRGSGRYALMHAVAMNTYHPTMGWFDFLSRRNRIRCQHAWYGRRCDRLELRWDGSHGRNASYTLQIRTKCDYGPDVRIQAHLTQLWFDTTMRGSTP